MQTTVKHHEEHSENQEEENLRKSSANNAVFRATEYEFRSADVTKDNYKDGKELPEQKMEINSDLKLADKLKCTGDDEQKTTDFISRASKKPKYKRVRKVRQFD